MRLAVGKTLLMRNLIHKWLSIAKLHYNIKYLHALLWPALLYRLNCSTEDGLPGSIVLPCGYVKDCKECYWFMYWLGFVDCRHSTSLSCLRQTSFRWPEMHWLQFQMWLASHQGQLWWHLPNVSFSELQKYFNQKYCIDSQPLTAQLQGMKFKMKSSHFWQLRTRNLIANSQVLVATWHILHLSLHHQFWTSHQFGDRLKTSGCQSNHFGRIGDCISHHFEPWNMEICTKLIPTSTCNTNT